MKTGPLFVSLAIIILFFLVGRKRKALASVWLPLGVAVVALAMVMLPEPSFKAAQRGLSVWWEVVLPALLPFFIAAELLMSTGSVHFMGVLMESVMRPLFNVPGAGSFTLAMGLASGYPLGAALSARLMEDGLATKTEAERLMCFCNTSDPLFMTGAVAVGMFKRTDLALIIVAAHYLSALTVGIAMRFWRSGSRPTPPQSAGESGPVLRRAFRAMREAQKKDGRAFGQLLGDAVKTSVNTLLVILGFMVLFSVIFEALKLAGTTAVLSSFMSRMIPESILPEALHDTVISGIFEITIGTSLAGAADAPLVARAAVASAIIAWSGLSVHAQVAAVIQPSGMSIWPYTLSRGAQGLLAALYTVLLMRPGGARWTISAFEPPMIPGSLAWLGNLGLAAQWCFLSVALVFFGGLLVFAWSSVKKPRKRT